MASRNSELTIVHYSLEITSAKGKMAMIADEDVPHRQPKYCIGNPTWQRISTSHVERTTLTLKMGIRRLIRLTNGFSKKWSQHEAAHSLIFAAYNFVQVHSTLKQTPAMAAGMTDHAWSVRELLDRAAQLAV